VHELVSNFDPFIALAVLGSAGAVDALGAYYIRTTARGEAFKAAITSAALIVLSSIAFFAFVNNPLYGGAEAIGAATGTYLVVKLDGRRSKMTSAR
jgi:CHASE2 domain-containing sensor protein